MCYHFSKTKRFLCFVGGLALMGFGVALSTRPNLGTSPVSTLPYVLTFIVPFSLGICTIFTNAIMIVCQILILKKDYKWIQCCQIFAAAVFGFFIDFGMWLTTFFIFNNYIIRMSEQILGCAFLAVGIACELVANVSYMPGEGLVQAISNHWRLNFGKVKIYFDITLVVLSIIVSLIFCHQIHGVGEGTLVSAILVGLFVKMIKSPSRNIKKLLVKQA